MIEQTDAVTALRKLPADQASPRGRIRYTHMPAAGMRQHLGPKQRNDSTIIATVRNPFARMIPPFHLCRSRNGAAPLTDIASTRAEFLEFLQSDSWGDDREVVTIDGEHIVDAAIRLEHLPGDTADVCDQLGLQRDPADMPITKSTKALRSGLGIADHPTPPAVSIVQDRMAWVLDHYDDPETPLH
ncbi:hypothetical protein [Actibacterium sp. XHP0104]|uniref:hypothetical protein n=1 Tax=Actibacterium sp. XHP0104 TaxID=2984335 RepID=UPI0021E90C94|nr:hypothetical protein [Actibacterium sp. XHP0104]